MKSRLMKIKGLSVTVGLALLMTSMATGPVLAHHGANLYDMTKTLKITGTIAKFYWGNPHNEITIDGTDEKGAAAQWVAPPSRRWSC
jgi:hypothetical protein